MLDDAAACGGAASPRALGVWLALPAIPSFAACAKGLADGLHPGDTAGERAWAARGHRVRQAAAALTAVAALVSLARGDARRTGTGGRDLTARRESPPAGR